MKLLFFSNHLFGKLLTMKSIARLLLFIGFFLMGYPSQSQPEDPSANIQTKIKDQVWKEFKFSYEGRDWQTFNALHTSDVLRVNKWSMRVGNEYKESNEQSFQRTNTPSRIFDIWIAEGQYSDTLAYQVGYYRITYDRPENSISYGRFHVVLKRIKGRWLIAQDWDTDEINGTAISEEDFAKGVPYSF
jgi:hypothetical protein